MGSMLTVKHKCKHRDSKNFRNKARKMRHEDGNCGFIKRSGCSGIQSALLPICFSGQLRYCNEKSSDQESIFLMDHSDKRESAKFSLGQLTK